MNFFYYYPVLDKPAGGKKQIRLTALLLAELGVDVYLLPDTHHAPELSDFDDNIFYALPVKIAPFRWQDAAKNLQPEDVLVLPEFNLSEILSVCSAWKTRIAVNNQNGFFALRYCPSRHECSSIVEFAIANAPYVASLCKRYYGLPAERIFLVPHWVVRPPFEFAPSENRKLAICYMPRKLPEQVTQIRDCILHLHPEVPWVEIDGVPELEVAKRYRENRIFFAAQDQEGCPLPALEAMASGCLVAGYPGTTSFAHPYATRANGLWAADRDIEQAVTAVQTAICVAREGGAAYHSFLQAGAQTANYYRKETVKAALTDLVNVVHHRSYSVRKNRVPRLSLRESLFAYRLRHRHHQPNWSGRVLAKLARLSGLSRLCEPGF